VLIDEDGNSLGWIGVIIFEKVWEIHPIAVAPEHQHKGYGRMLVDDILALARADGAVAVWAGTGDETGSTSFSGGLYGGPWPIFESEDSLRRAITRDTDWKWTSSAVTERFEAPHDHPVNFWSSIGFMLVGIVPDKGVDKVGIHFAQRLDEDGT
jgi:aminoglycoside 6'-N-acetyltransferase I